MSDNVVVIVLDSGQEFRSMHSDRLTTISLLDTDDWVTIEDPGTGGFASVRSRRVVAVREEEE